MTYECPFCQDQYAESISMIFDYEKQFVPGNRYQNIGNGRCIFLYVDPSIIIRPLWRICILYCFKIETSIKTSIENYQVLPEALRSLFTDAPFSGDFCFVEESEVRNILRRCNSLQDRLQNMKAFF